MDQKNITRKAFNDEQKNEKNEKKISFILFCFCGREKVTPVAKTTDGALFCKLKFFEKIRVQQKNKVKKKVKRAGKKEKLQIRIKVKLNFPQGTRPDSELFMNNSEDTSETPVTCVLT